MDLWYGLSMWLLKRIDQDAVEDYANVACDMMTSDDWRDQAGEARSARYDAMD